MLSGLSNLGHGDCAQRGGGAGVPLHTEVCKQSLGVGFESCTLVSNVAIRVCAETVAEGGPGQRGNL